MRTLPDELGTRDIQVLRFIVSFHKDLGISPTYREIQRHFNLSSTEQVLRCTQRLRALGFLSSNPRLKGRSRNLIPTALADRYLRRHDEDE